MANEDHTIWITFNGEIYNHRELRRQLEAAGHRYRSQTDTETILHAYEAWGDNCVQHFRGMFAFALWDAPRRRLLLARDRLGIKPLYYARPAPNRLIFASEIKALFASRMVQPEVAPTAVPEYLLFGYLSGGDTMFRDITALPPAHVLTWDSSGIQVRSYWDLEFRPHDSASPRDLQQTFDRLFDDAVQSHMISDVPLGVFLSGGIDSSAIAAVMTRHAPGRLKTFSIGFPKGQYSELPYARMVARHLDTEHHEFVLTPHDFLCSLPRMIWHEDEPIWTIASVAMHHLARCASQHVKVVLTGEGSDELFAGYDRYWCGLVNDRLRPFYGRVPSRCRNAIRKALGVPLMPRRIRRILSHTLLCRDLSLEDLIFDNWFGVFTPSMQAQLGSDALRRSLAAVDPYAAHVTQYESPSSDRVVDRMMYADLKTNLVELLMKQDRMTMAASIESRVPFLDHRLVEFAARAPRVDRFWDVFGKRLLRKTARTMLPPAIVSRRKQGFPVPFDNWLQTHFFGAVSQLLMAENGFARRWFQPAKLESLLTAHRTGRQNFSRQVWSLLSLELWGRIFLDGDRRWLEAPAEAWELTGHARSSSPARRRVAVRAMPPVTSPPPHAAAPGAPLA